MRIEKNDIAWGLGTIAAIVVLFLVTYFAIVAVSDEQQDARRPDPTITVTLTPSPAPTVTVTAKPKPAPTVTVTKIREVSRSVSRPAPKTSRRSVSFEEWLSSPTARKVLRRESGGRCDAVNPSGKYRGRWQMDATFWRVYGGLKYAPRPDLATCHEQNLVAYKGWLYRGWSPWSTA